MEIAKNNKQEREKKKIDVCVCVFSGWQNSKSEAFHIVHMKWEYYREKDRQGMENNCRYVHISVNNNNDRQIEVLLSRPT